MSDQHVSKDRYGQAYVNMNLFIWDPIFNNMPKNWVNMSDTEKIKCKAFQRNMKKLLDILSPMEQSKYWWTLKLGKTEKEWKQYWEAKQKLKEINY